MRPQTVTDPTRCPLCGQPNACAMEVERATGQPQPPCWCTQVDFSPALLDQVPPESRGQACICRACAERAAPAPPLISSLAWPPAAAPASRPARAPSRR